jgi:hypothetical protein
VNGGSPRHYKPPQPTKKNTAGAAANHPCCDRAYHLGAEVGSAVAEEVIDGSPHRYKPLQPTEKNAVGVAANHPCRDRAYHLDAEVGSAGTTGMIGGSPRRYKPPRLSKKMRPTQSYLAALASHLATHNYKHHGYQLARLQFAHPYFATHNLHAPRTSQLPARASQLATRNFSMEP